jgi:hypothetical protein
VAGGAAGGGAGGGAVKRRGRPKKEGPTTNDPGERCRKPVCKERIGKLEEQVKALQTKLTPLQRGFHVQVRGEVRAALSDEPDKADTIACLRQQLAASENLRRHWYKASKDQTETICKLTHDLATAQESLAALQAAYAGELQQQTSRARSESRVQAASRLERDKAAARAASAEAAASEAQAQARQALVDAAAAREDADAEATAARAAEQAKDDAQYQAMLSERKVARAQKSKERALKRLKELAPPVTVDSSADEWAKASRKAREARRFRALKYLRSVVGSPAIRCEEVVTALQEEGMLKDVVLKTKEGFDIVFDLVDSLMHQLQEGHYGVEVGMFFRYELRMTWDDCLRLNQAASRKYDRPSDSYVARPLLHHPYRKGKVIKARRAPTMSI